MNFVKKVLFLAAAINTASVTAMQQNDDRDLYYAVGADGKYDLPFIKDQLQQNPDLINAVLFDDDGKTFSLVQQAIHNYVYFERNRDQATELIKFLLEQPDVNLNMYNIFATFFDNTYYSMITEFFTDESGNIVSIEDAEFEQEYQDSLAMDVDNGRILEKLLLHPNEKKVRMFILCRPGKSVFF